MSERRVACSTARQRALRAASASLAAFVLAIVPVALAPTTDAATSTGLRAEAAAIAAKVTADNAALATIGARYLAATASYRKELVALGETRQKLRSVRAEIGREQRLLQQAAVQAYVGQGTNSSFALYLTGELGRITTSNAYLGVASRIVSSAVVSLSNDRITLSATLVSENRTAVAAAGAQRTAGTERSHALATLQSEQATLASVQGRLATLVAEEAAAAARAAAARAAAAAAAAAATAGPPPPSSVSSISTTAAVPTSLAASFAAIRNCESSGDYALNTGNGYYGAYQFSGQTWLDLGYSGLPNQAAPAVQDAAAYKLYRASGWAAWPECAAIAGLS